MSELTDLSDTVRSISQRQIRQTVLISDRFETLEGLLTRFGTSQSQAGAILQGQNQVLGQIKRETDSSSTRIEDVLRDTDNVLSNQNKIMSKLDDTNYSLNGVSQKLTDIQLTTQDLNSKADRSLRSLTDTTTKLSQGMLQFQDMLAKFKELHDL